MSKPKVDTSKLGPMSPENVAKHNAKMRAGANATGRGMMDQVQAAIDIENAHMNAQFEGDAHLRAWAKGLLGFEISMNQIDQLRDAIVQAKPGPFIFQGQVLMKTAFQVADRADRYIFALEKTIIDLTAKPQYTDLSFFGLINLAFKRLFTRSK